VTIFRGNTSNLYMWDFKMSNNDIYEMPAGSVAMLVGFEARKESYTDERDPRMNGEITYTVPNGALAGTTFPLISDIVNSSATPNSGGSRVTYSFNSELAIPLHEDIDMQLAIRAEDSSDYGEAVVSKMALGWQVMDQVKVRYSK
jgi:outer membrane cobalamin receptor